MIGYHPTGYSGLQNPAGLYQRLASAAERVFSGLEGLVSQKWVTPEGIVLPGVMYGRSGGPSKAKRNDGWVNRGSKHNSKGHNSKRKKEKQKEIKRERHKREEANPSGRSKYAQRKKRREQVEDASLSDESCGPIKYEMLIDPWDNF